MADQHVQVGIIGAGPCGLLLGELLRLRGVTNVIVERQSAEHVRSRIRAGVLEPGSVETLGSAGVGDHPREHGLVMSGVNLRWGNEQCRIDFGLVHKRVTVYGQTHVTEDLMQSRLRGGGVTVYEAANVAPHDIVSERPWLSFEVGGSQQRVDCDFIAGCDGAHGVSRKAIPLTERREFKYGFPFGWLGLLADVPPLGDEVSWVNHPDGFAMCSLRSATRSRFYIQVDRSESLEDWSAERFFEVFSSRLPDDLRSTVHAGDALEMSITPLESYVCENMRYGKMFLLGDAAHTVPPTGAKGLNLAISDAEQMAGAFEMFYGKHDATWLDVFAERALARVWRAVRFSWWMTNLTHRITGNPFERKVQVAELGYTRGSDAAQIAIAENFCGLI